MGKEEAQTDNPDGSSNAAGAMKHGTAMMGSLTASRGTETTGAAAEEFPKAGAVAPVRRCGEDRRSPRSSPPPSDDALELSAAAAGTARVSGAETSTSTPFSGEEGEATAGSGEEPEAPVTGEEGVLSDFGGSTATATASVAAAAAAGDAGAGRGFSPSNSSLSGRDGASELGSSAIAVSFQKLRRREEGFAFQGPGDGRDEEEDGILSLLLTTI